MILSATNTGSIAGIPTCHKIVFRNTGTIDVYWGWETDVSAGGATQGIPLLAGSSAPGEGVILDGNSNLSRPIFFAAAGAFQVNYTQMT